MADDKKKQIRVKYDSDQEIGTYSNAVSIHINKNELVIDFGYIMPTIKPTTIKMASRINLTHATAESLLKILSNAILDWKNKQKEIA